MAAVADEERGATFGTRWLVEKHPCKVRTDYVINEGGGFVLRTKTHPVYLLEAEEKGALRIRITCKGIAGHASIPELGVSAVTTMSQILVKIADHRTQVKASPTLKQMLHALGEQGVFEGLPSNALLNDKTADQALAKIRERDKVMSAYLSALLRPTIAETMIKGGVAGNVIPDYCEAVINCRLPPGVTKEEMLEELRKIIGPVEGVEFEITGYVPASTSPTDNQFYETMVKVLKTTVGEKTEVVPFVQTGRTDSCYLRPLGSIAYGFGPTSPNVDYRELIGLVHGINERINVESLFTCTEFLEEICRIMLC